MPCPVGMLQSKPGTLRVPLGGWGSPSPPCQPPAHPGGQRVPLHSPSKAKPSRRGRCCRGCSPWCPGGSDRPGAWRASSQPGGGREGTTRQRWHGAAPQFFIGRGGLHEHGARGIATCPPLPILPQPVPSGAASTHLPALEGLGDGVQPWDVVLVHAGDVAGVVERGPVAHQKLFADRAGSARPPPPLPRPSGRAGRPAYVLVVIDDGGRVSIPAIQVESGHVLFPAQSPPQPQLQDLGGGAAGGSSPPAAAPPQLRGAVGIPTYGVGVLLVHAQPHQQGAGDDDHQQDHHHHHDEEALEVVAAEELAGQVAEQARHEAQGPLEAGTAGAAGAAGTFAAPGHAAPGTFGTAKGAGPAAAAQFAASLGAAALLRILRAWGRRNAGVSGKEVGAGGCPRAQRPARFP